MDLERPRFRHDLVARPLEDAGVFYVDVTDPSSGAEFRFYDVEYSIACAMDGDRDIDGLVTWTRAELGVETTKDELKTVVTTLAGLGYLDSVAARPGAVEVVDLTQQPPLTFGDQDQEPTRPAHREMAQAAAALGGNDFETDEPTRNGGIPQSNELVVDSGLVEMEMSVSAAARMDDSVTTQLPRGDAEAMAKLGEAAAVSGVPLGGAANDDLEVDLSAHVAVDKQRLDEAVRQSRAHTVPTVLDDLAKESAADAPRQGSVATKLPTAPPAQAATQVNPPVAASTPAPRSAASVPLLLFLVLAIAGAAAYYFLVYKQDQTMPRPLPRVNLTTEPAGAPREPTGIVATAEAPPVTITAPAAAVIEWTVPDGQAVVEGEIVVRLAGAKRAEATLTQHKERLTFYQGELSKMNAANKAAGAAAAQKKVDEKQALVDQAQALVDPLVVKVTAGGPAQVLVGAGARVVEGDPILRVVPKAFSFTVEFKDAPVGLLVGAPVKLALASQRDRQLPGVVEKVAHAQVLVRLIPPVDLKPGDSVVLLAP